jgi:hypothetical protein
MDHVHGAPELGGHPGRAVPTGPQSSIWRWFAQPLLQLGPLLGRQQGARTGLSMPAIAKPGQSGSVVPPCAGAHPIARIARHGRDMGTGLSARK